jgi:hypothetical protein
MANIFLQRQISLDHTYINLLGICSIRDSIDGNQPLVFFKDERVV